MLDYSSKGFFYRIYKYLINSIRLDYTYPDAPDEKSDIYIFTKGNRDETSRRKSVVFLRGSSKPAKTYIRKRIALS